MEYTTNFISPFEKRTFSERFRAVLMFTKQNFLQVLKYDLLMFVIASLLVSLVVTVTGKSVNNVGGLFNFLCFSYFTLYISNRGNMRTVSFKEMLNKTGGAFVNVLDAGIFMLLILILPLLILVAITVLVIIPIVSEMVSDKMFAIIISLIPFMLVLFYLYPIISVYYSHNYFFPRESRGHWWMLIESYRLVKGHWWSSFGFVCLFEIMGGIVIILTILFIALLCKSFLSSFLFNFIGYTVIFPIAFFSSHVAMVYQYGHLRALKEEREKEFSDEFDK